MAISVRYKKNNGQVVGGIGRDGEGPLPAENEFEANATPGSIDFNSGDLSDPTNVLKFDPATNPEAGWIDWSLAYYDESEDRLRLAKPSELSAFAVDAIAEDRKAYQNRAKDALSSRGTMRIVMRAMVGAGVLTSGKAIAAFQDAIDSEE